MGCPIQKSTDQRIFAPPRSLSQLITSFIASESLGIHHAPLLTFLLVLLNRNMRLSKPMILFVIANMSMYVSRCMRNVISINTIETNNMKCKG